MPRNLTMSKYNATLGCYTFNIPAGRTCAMRCHYCYAMKGQFMFPGVAESHDKNWEATQDLETFMETMGAEVERIQSKGQWIYRIHSAGDFYSLDYLAAWVEIARAYPGMRFFTYTKRWVQGATWVDAVKQAMIDAPNLTIRLSQDSATGPAPTGMLTATVLDRGSETLCSCLKQSNPSWSKRLPSGQMVHMKGDNCSTCGRCAARFVGNVAFKLH